MFMNLAGVPRDAVAREVLGELAAAGVEAVAAATPGEVDAGVAGRLGPYRFTRAWRYWVVEGPVPLAVAEALYADPAARASVRVAGHCACPPPAEWVRWVAPDGREVHPTRTARELLDAIDAGGVLADACDRTLRACHFRKDPAAYPGVRGFVPGYHVDDRAGLRLLADALRDVVAGGAPPPLPPEVPPADQ